MGSELVIVLLPVINDFPGMKNIAEPEFMQAFIPKATVETLNNTYPLQFNIIS